MLDIVPRAIHRRERSCYNRVAHMSDMKGNWHGPSSGSSEHLLPTTLATFEERGELFSRSARACEIGGFSYHN